MYPLPIYSTEILREVLFKFTKLHRNICHSATLSFPLNVIFDIFLCNTYRSHLLHFTDIQYSIISTFHFVADGHLSCFQFMTTTYHATVNSLVHIS